MQKRPSDNTIRIGRILFGLILSSSLYYNLIVQGDSIESTILFMSISEANIEYVKYGLAALGIIPIFMGATNICLAKKKYMRIIQIIFGIVLFYISSIIVESATLDVDSLIAFMGFFPLIAGITGKCISSNCMRYAEKVTKIRV